jgi:hypothetical protein
MKEKPPSIKLKESLPKSLELARILENTENVEEIKEKLGLLLKMIEQDLHVEFVSNVALIYNGMQSEDCLVRTEQLSRVLESIEFGVPLHISDDTDSHYANAVLPVPEGIKIAFSEGRAPGPIRAAIGFGKTIIGFKTDHISVSEIDFQESEIRDYKERKHLCRHVSGDLKKEDIRYLVMRIPSHFLEEKYLTSEEKNKKSKFIFRGFKV